MAGEGEEEHDHQASVSGSREDWPVPHPPKGEYASGMWMLLLANAGAAESARWGIADRDAGCGLATVEAALDIQVQYDRALDSFIGDLLPYAAFMPVPDECAGRMSVYVESVEATDLRVCARIVVGPGAGRAFCSGIDAEVVEQASVVLTDPVEPGGTEMDAVQTQGVIEAYAFDPTLAPPQVVVGALDGRVVALLDAAQTVACARSVLWDLAIHELSYDAAFDGYVTDLDHLGFALERPRHSCQAYVAVRVASASVLDFRAEVVVLEGPMRRRGFAMSKDLVPVDAGLLTADRVGLAADGWTLGEPLPR